MDLRILFLSIYDPYSKHDYGAENHLRNLSEQLRNLGCEIHILMPGTKTCTTKKNGIFIHSLRSPFFGTFGWGITFSLSVVRIIDRICAEYGIDIVHGQSPSSFGYALIRRRKRPFAVTIHGTSFGEVSSFFNIPAAKINLKILQDAIVVQPLTALLTKMEYKYADKIVAVSDAVAREAARYYRLPEKKIVVIHSGVNLPTLTDAVEEEQKIGHNILVVGRLIWRKGIHYLIEALPFVVAEYSDVRLMVVGEGEQKASLEDCAKRLRIEKNVRFLGRVSSEKLHSLYLHADVYVQPSLYEPLGIAILEAMSMGKPIVASRVGGIPELVTSGVEGLLVEPGNAFQLGESIRSLFSDSSLRRKCGHNARRKVETDFTWTKAAQQTLNLYEDLVLSKRSIEKTQT
jgi:glycosyltransferase involved in cell wall biosynthesis